VAQSSADCSFNGRAIALDREVGMGDAGVGGNAHDRRRRRAGILSPTVSIQHSAPLDILFLPNLYNEGPFAPMKGLYRVSDYRGIRLVGIA
jgi:hypothetical protein